MRNERRDLAWYYGEEIGGRLWRALARQLANRKTQLGVDEDTLALEDVQVWAELGAPEVFSVLDLALSAQDAALRVRARVDLTSASVPVQVEAVARTEDAKEMQDYAAYFCEKGLVRLSAGLVPELGEDDLDALAERLLAAYYPEALEKPRRVDAHEMAERMGLAIKCHRIAAKQDIYGEIFFAEAEPQLFYDNRKAYSKNFVKSKTMVVDPTATYMGEVGTYDGTIVHECLHWALHGQAMALRRAQQPDSQEPAICCRVDGGVANPDDAVLLALENQANTLVPHVQMPLAQFRQRANALLKGHNQSENWSRSRCIVMPSVIDDLADFFGVSRQAAKLRLIEAGYVDAAGAYVYIDGRYLPPHGWTPGALKENETFSIPAEEAARLLMEDADFARAAQGYLYVDGHFVLDDPRYVGRDHSGEWHLTEAAYLNMERYCLKFTLSVQDSGTVPHTRYAQMCLLSQSKGIPLDPAFLSCSPEQQAEQLAEIRAERDRILGKIKASPEKAWKILIEWRETNQSELESVTGLARETINKLATGKTPGNKQTVLLMCFALQLPPEISKFMLGYSKNALAEENESENCCLYLLHTGYMLPLPTILNYLEKYCNIYLR